MVPGKIYEDEEGIKTICVLDSLSLHIGTFSLVPAASAPEIVRLLMQQSAQCPGKQYCCVPAHGIIIPGGAVLVICSPCGYSSMEDSIF